MTTITSDHVQLFQRHMNHLLDGDWWKVLLSTILGTVASLLRVDTVLVVAIMIMIFFDLIAGVHAAKKRGEHVTSEGYRRTVSKVITYAIFIGAVAVPDNAFGLNGWVIRPFVLLVLFTELKSITEHLFGVESSFYKQVQKIFKTWMGKS